MTAELILTAVGTLLLLGILASKASGRLGLPALVLFLLVGMLAGSEGLGGIEFDNFVIAQFLGTVALAFILFAGGLDTRWSSVRPVLWQGVGLATVAVTITAVGTGLFAWWLLDFSLLEGLLLGAIVSSTDAAAVFSVMRNRGTGLRERIKRILEFESGSNDPMAIFLTVGLIGLMQDPDSSYLTLIPSFVLQMALGILAGYGLGRLMVWLINRIDLQYDGLYPVFTVSVVLLVYSVTTLVGGNGFLAVYVAGLSMNHYDFIHKRSIARFHDGLAWLMQTAMFIALGLLVFPSQLWPVAGAGVLLALFLIFVARPLGVFATLWPMGVKTSEMAIISWVGLRGAVPIILATYPLVAGVPNAAFIFNVVFFVVVASVVLQGPFIPLIAKWLRVDAPLQQTTRYPLELEQTVDLDSDLVEVPVPPGSPAAGKKILELGLPDQALIVLLSRDGAFVVPRGATTVEPNDRLLVLADETDLASVRALVGARTAEAALE